MTLFATIDHAANARSVGATMPAPTVLIYGNALRGTPIMLATPQTRAGTGRVDGKALVAFHPVAAMLRRAGVPEDIAARLEPARRLLLSASSP